MYPLKLLATFAILVAKSEATTENDTLQMEIEALQKQRNDLFKQINDAIEDSVHNLKISNDSDALLGISFITDLKDKLQELNDTIDDSEEDELNIDDVNNNRTYGEGDKVNMRRQLEEDLEYQMKIIEETRKQKDLGKDFRDKLFDNRHKTERDKKRYENRETMAKRVHEWLKARAIKKAIKKQKSEALKKKYGKPEKCPRYGVDPKKRRKGRSGKYPCCRKCCKNSVLGCLKKK